MERAEPVYSMVWPMTRLPDSGELLTADCNPALVCADQLLAFINSLWKAGPDAALVAEMVTNSTVGRLWVALPGGATEDFKHSNVEEAQRMLINVAHKQRIRTLRRAGWPAVLADASFTIAVVASGFGNPERN